MSKLKVYRAAFGLEVAQDTVLQPLRKRLHVFCVTPTFPSGVQGYTLFEKAGKTGDK